MITIIKTISTTIDDLKRRIQKAYRFGKSDVVTAPQAGPYGLDSNPIKDMVAVYAETSEKGKSVIIGYVLKNQLSKVSPGETRLYSTDEDGAEQFEIHLKKDGTAEIGGDGDNMVRFSKLQEGFDKLKEDFNNLVTAFNAHMHPTAGTGAPSPPTPVPGSIPASSSSASIDDAKIDEIKTL